MCSGASGGAKSKLVGGMVSAMQNKTGYFRSHINGVDSSKPAVTPQPTVMSGLRSRGDDAVKRKTLLGGR